ncbi:MAG: hypothetical protein H6733_01505 [Alphaproteobacteria bacterium]|nr:hypothetical protein [Alphaproteobacteria bacterium]
MVRWMAVTVGLALAGCAAPTDDDGDTDTDTVAAVDDGVVTYHRDVRPIFDRHCAACHTDGGVAPFSMTYAADAWADGPPSWVPTAVAAMEAGTMPPWMPSQDCQPIQGARVLPDGALDTVTAWADGGFVEGDPSTYKARTTDAALDLGEPTLTLRGDAAYTPDRARPDDYRCFVLDHTFEEEAWLDAFTVVPDALSMVHHVILYRLDADYADDVARWDAEDDGPGYTCFGSPGTWEAETVAGWAPGSTPEVYGDDLARRISAGSVLVLQMHYNTLTLPTAATTPSDRTGVALWLGERPRLELRSFPFADLDLYLPAGDPDVSATFDASLDFLTRNVRLKGAFPHMHQLGVSMRVDVVRDDGSETCLVDIPDWDFNWQQAYFYDDDVDLFVGPDDQLRISCTYDNSTANQPVVNGSQLEPRDVAWGDGSLDEMCLAYLYASLPVAQ